MQQLQALKRRYLASGCQNAAHFYEIQSLPADRALRCTVPIQDCNESLQPIPKAIDRCSPHPYEQLGAPYGDTSPYALRQTALTRLIEAQAHLDTLRPGCRLQVFDAYRPLAVQAFMIEHETRQLAARRHLGWDRLDRSGQEALRGEVRRFWAAPDHDPTHPPPHSTGAALDVTITDSRSSPLPMGTPIDHVGSESLPSHYAQATESQERLFDQNRQLLNQAMSRAGFRRLPYEWWHFSYGDQWWALLEYLERDDFAPVACYGRLS